ERRLADRFARDIDHASLDLLRHAYAFDGRDLLHEPRWNDVEIEREPARRAALETSGRRRLERARIVELLPRQRDVDLSLDAPIGDALHLDRPSFGAAAHSDDRLDARVDRSAQLELRVSESVTTAAASDANRVNEHALEPSVVDLTTAVGSGGK